MKDFAFHTPVSLNTYPFKISLNNSLLFMGSCFSEHVGNFAKNINLRAMNNPCGIIYNPVSLLNVVELMQEKIRINESDLVENNELWHSWLHHGDFSHADKGRAVEAMKLSIKLSKSLFENQPVVIITLGSSFCFELESTKQIVANCHKFPSHMFQRRLLSMEEIESALEKMVTGLKNLNQQCRIVFSVSPVRHLRDGLIQNNRSKAQLISAVHQTVDNHKESVFYFPAFEILTDELRDYRYYNEDMVHPSAFAVKHVIRKFTDSFFDERMKEFVSKMQELNKAKEHKPLFPNSSKHEAFQQQTLEMQRKIRGEFPEVGW